VLGIILATYLMIVLDLSVVVTALPSIRHALDFSSADLSWVQSAYALTFGGFLLLGARAGDILGRRRTFVVGIAVFTAASLLGGLAQSSTWLLTARAVQGIGAAIAAPSTLALLTVNFPEGPERTRALAAYSGVAGGGGSVGLVLGGMLTAWISWRWGLFINVPVGIALIVLAPRFLAETERRTGHFDVLGAITSTLGSSALVYGFVRAASDGWGDPLTLVSFAAAALLIAAFVLRERYAAQPITPLRLFRDRERAGALVARILVVGAMFSMFFFLSQYLQGVRGWSALHTGLAFLPLTLVLFGMVQVVPRLSARIGDRRLLIGGVAVAGAGMAWLCQLSESTAFFPAIAVPLVVLGLGMGAAIAPLTAFGIVRVRAEDAGAGSGLVNVAHQLGGSLGLSVLVTVFTAGQHAAEAHPLAGAGAAAQAQHVLAHGVSAALTGSLVGLTVALAVVVLGMRRAPVREAVAAAPVTRWALRLLRT
jgi:EmrB/QacA subfamily drug resistance transporter